MKPSLFPMAVVLLQFSPFFALVCAVVTVCADGEGRARDSGPTVIGQDFREAAEPAAAVYDLQPLHNHYCVRVDRDVFNPLNPRQFRLGIYSWVRPGVQGDTAMCWLKNVVPPVANDANTASGVVR